MLRWLLIVFTMAGLGISGVHCADDLVAVPATALNPGVDLSQFADVHPVAVEIAAPHVDQDGGDLTARPRPGRHR
ncbi:MAG: hypothetical protein QOH97_1568 [Actinoplanes sp.]|nr:hypothetical protein [Actinoplanes sp.]